MRRYYNELMLCKLEDFSVSTFLDPRYKALSFKHLDHWDKGKLMKERVIEWSKAAYTQDWKPSRGKTVSKQVAVHKAELKKQLVSFLEDSDDEEEVAVVLPRVEAVEPENGAEEADCEFTLYSAMAPVRMSEDPGSVVGR
ncbi:hypothetical protein CYMTET_31647 [Cymbomonas tetramitiformis]|uniref:Uncharacterized protein n=1 Tax=Cymbomonas tetramitiformis TaxID=36881 RepID=A0AAE0FGV5_9CHLO|nr:hypothetical protein CYMTET_31647 [Cymbomonas tetramitiformis]|eukprot:gene34458-biopygen30645